MKKVIVLIFGIFLSNLSFGQQIDMKLNYLGYKFVQNEERLTWNELVDATENNIEANLLIKKAKNHHTVSTILSLAGGALIGIPIGQSISDRDPDWIFAYIGGGLTLVSIPFTFGAFNKVNEGIDNYNLSLKTASNQLKPEFNILANGKGIGLSVNF